MVPGRKERKEKKEIFWSISYPLCVYRLTASQARSKIRDEAFV